MEWKLPEISKVQYDSMLKGVQDIEASIGSSQYRLHKLLVMREDIDKALKTWWDDVLQQLELDPKKDYMIDKSGNVQDVTKPSPEVIAQPDVVGESASELK